MTKEEKGGDNLTLHIFWDNSNIWGGAQATRVVKEPEVPQLALRVYFRNLYELVSAGREVTTKIMGGSVPPESEALWEYAHALGFNTDLLYRITDGQGQVREQAVDEILHLKMANAVMDFEAPQTMALLSGDGKMSKFNTSFPLQLERALKFGWNVEVYSWGTACNRKYSQLAAANPDKMKLALLDERYNQLTFVQGGEYYRRDQTTGEKIFFVVPSRVVQSLG